MGILGCIAFLTELMYFCFAEVFREIWNTIAYYIKFVRQLESQMLTSHRNRLSC